MAKITSPFNFVPLSDLVFYPQWSDDISHDIPFEDGEDGIIELEITNKSPLFIGEGDTNNPDNRSSHIMVDGIRRYYIPGTTLKGCFRNVMEILSYGKMEQYDDDSFGFREVAHKDSKVRNYYHGLVRNVRCGWLWKEYDRCYLEECVKGIQKIDHDEIRRIFRLNGILTDDDIMKLNVANHVVDVKENEYFFYKNNNKVFVNPGTYCFVGTGQIKGKNHEYLFSLECKDRVEISPRVIDRFETVHKVTPSFEIKKDGKGYFREDYDNGKKIPVFFITNETGVTCIGLTQNMKYPYKYSIKDLVKKNYGEDVWMDFENKRDLPQCIFGSIGKSSLKGRVQIGNAFTDAEIRDEELLHVSGVLAQPKASYYPLYLKQDGKTIVNYSTTQSTIAGRKRYRITKGFQTIPLGQGNGNENYISHLNALPDGLIFRCLIGVHNLKKAEIGALLSSITFNQTGGCYHNIGMAKAFGYGSIECSIKALHGLQHNVSDYIDYFDELMVCFLRENGRRLSSEESYRQLAGIASPTHVPEEMKQMDFDECRTFTQEINASVLTEEPKDISIGINEEEAMSNVLKRYEAEVCRRAEILAADNRWSMAVDLLNDLLLKLAKDNFDSSSVKGIISAYQAKEKAYNEEKAEQERARLEEMHALEKQKMLADIESAKAARKERGLAFLLETKVNSSELKISALSQGVSRIKDFLKKNKGYALTSDDVESLHEWLRLLEIPKKKQDKKDFEDFNGVSWTYIATLSDNAKLWFDEINER